MPVSRGRKPTHQKSLARSQARSKITTTSRWQRLLTPWRMFVYLVGLVAAGVTCWEFYVGTIPEVHLHQPPSTNSSSQLLPLLVHNPSSTFDMYDVNFECFPDDEIEQKDGRPVFGMHFFNNLHQATSFKELVIPAGQSVNTSCNITDTVSGGLPIYAVQIHLEIIYSTRLLFFKKKRRSVSIPMTGYDSGSKFEWFEGTITNPRPFKWFDYAR